MTAFLEQFQNHWQTLQFSTDSKILVAVSGGIDSMVLCDLLLDAKIDFSIAHCNFQLRAEESDLDQEFIRKYAETHRLELFTEKFDVEEFKRDKNLSTQMAAREIRYTWFDELMNQYAFDYLLTAHHLNDSLETFIINLSRGTGLEGLLGIKKMNHSIVRPLLPFSKTEIAAYARKKRLAWREDLSNASLNYIRNKVRHQISPVLNELHPNFLLNFNTSIQNLEGDWQLIQNHLELIQADLFKSVDENIVVSIEKLKQLKPLHTYLFHLFSDYGFKYPFEVEKFITSDQNGEIRSENFRMIKNREQIILTKNDESQFNEEIVINEDQILEKPLYLKVSTSNKRDSSATETFDLAKIEFPLRLRKHKTGDIFHPIGMKGSKKVSKYFKDEKYSKLDKERTWLLVDSKDQIIYIVGKRMDDRFKITEHTHNFLNLYL